MLHPLLTSIHLTNDLFLLLLLLFWMLPTDDVVQISIVKYDILFYCRCLCLALRKPLLLLLIFGHVTPHLHWMPHLNSATRSFDLAQKSYQKYLFFFLHVLFPEWQVLYLLHHWTYFDLGQVKLPNGTFTLTGGKNYSFTLSLSQVLLASKGSTD